MISVVLLPLGHGRYGPDVGELCLRVCAIDQVVVEGISRSASLARPEQRLVGLGFHAVIGRSDGLSQGEFTQKYEMGPSRVTRTAQSLEADGFIHRERDPEDNRVVRMYLTEDGREVLLKLPAINDKLRRRIHGVLGEEEFEELRRMLGLLAEAMKE